MAFGGGKFITQNKVLPGAYINVVSASRASATLSDRGVVTIPFVLDWGVDGEVFEVTAADFQKDSLKIFGYDYAHEKLKPLREVFLHAQTLLAYKLNKGVKASNTYATAKYTGVRGNDIKITVQNNVDEGGKFDVITYLGTKEVDRQTVQTAAGLVANDFVTWKSQASLTPAVAQPLQNGTNGEVNAGSHQAYLNAIEGHAFNIIGIDTSESSIKQLYTAFIKRLRDEIGAKCQLVVHSIAADHEGVINVKNTASDGSVVYWVAGLEATCLVNKSCMGVKYDGELNVACDFTQTQLEKAVKDGEFVLCRDGKDIVVLTDINSLTTVTDEKGEDFKSNQVIRVIDQLATDIALVFKNKYKGKQGNNVSGREALWSDIVKIHEELQRIDAIEDFKNEDVTVEKGNAKKKVVAGIRPKPVVAMEQLYMTVVVV